MNALVLVIYITNIFVISPYTYELIEELIPKTIIFNLTDSNSFKIFKYIPSCLENEDYKSIYLQFLNDRNGTYNIYIYDDFSKIAQNSDSKFENYINHYRIISLENSVLFSNLNCKKEYYFVISLNIYKYRYEFPDIYYPTLSGLLFNIIDGKTDIINLSPELSDIFAFQQRDRYQQEIIFYSHTETKKGLISFSTDAKIQIFKNNEIIYEKGEEDYKKELLLEKNENYTFYFMGNNSHYFFSLQLFNETSNLNYYDFKNGPITLYYSPLYFIEVDISQFELNDIILIDFYAYWEFTFQYQYKSKFKENYFNHLGRYKKHNYFPIKKEIKDSSLIIRIEMIDYLDFNIMNLIPHKIDEINSEFNQIIKGPKYYYIDYFKFNNMNSIGFLANESFFFFEEKIEYITYASSYYDNIFITSLNNYMANSFKNAIIYFNSSNNILFEIKKYNYSFLDKDPNQYIPDYEYFQLCQGNDTLDELYFYRKNYDIFQPVFGSFDSYFIKKTDIKT